WKEHSLRALGWPENSPPEGALSWSNRHFEALQEKPCVLCLTRRATPIEASPSPRELPYFFSWAPPSRSLISCWIEPRELQPRGNGSAVKLWAEDLLDSAAQVPLVLPAGASS